MINKEGQNDPRKAWLWMALYWSVGHFVAVEQGYYNSLLSFRSPTLWHLFSVLVTFGCQRKLNDRFSSFGRKLEVSSVVVFGLANGVFETFCFLFMYDLGRKHLSQTFSLSNQTSTALGFVIFSAYSGLIHAFFWIRLVFPKHTRPEAPSFHKHGLPLLTLISIAWLGLYEMHSDIFCICSLHCVVDLWGGYNIHLPSPFSFSSPPEGITKTHTH